MLTSYHCHSRWSDGEGEIADFVRHAAEIGLDEIGLSDHYVLTPDRLHVEWAMPLDALDRYRDVLRSAAEEAGPNLIVRLGLEADFIPETAGDLRDLLADRPFDYVIGSVHSVDGFPIDTSPDDWTRLSQTQRDGLIRAYWVRIRQMAESGIYDFAGHLDLTKKFGFYPSVDISSEVSAALDAIAAAGMAAELNTSGWHVPACEAYPSPDIVRGCFERGIPMLVTADAHTPANIVRSFKRGYRLLRETGYQEVASFWRRSLRCQPMPERVD